MSSQICENAQICQNNQTCQNYHNVKIVRFARIVKFVRIIKIVRIIKFVRIFTFAGIFTFVRFSDSQKPVSRGVLNDNNSGGLERPLRCLNSLTCQNNQISQTSHICQDFQICQNSQICQNFQIVRIIGFFVKFICQKKQNKFVRKLRTSDMQLLMWESTYPWNSQSWYCPECWNWIRII